MRKRTIKSVLCAMLVTSMVVGNTAMYAHAQETEGQETEEVSEGVDSLPLDVEQDNEAITELEAEAEPEEDLATENEAESEQAELVYDEDMEYPEFEENDYLAGSGVTGQVNSMYFSPTYRQTSAREQLDWINEFRTGSDAWEWASDNTTKIYRNNLQPLKYDYDLEFVAKQRAAEIAIYFDHTRPNGEPFITAYQERLRETTYGWESLSVGDATDHDAFVGWREDNENYNGQAHRRNMLNPRVNAVACAHLIYHGVHYYVQEFRYADDVGSYYPPSDGSQRARIDILDSNVGELTLKVLDSFKSISLKPGDMSVISANVQTYYPIIGSIYPNSRYYVDSSQYDLSSADDSIATTWNGAIKGVSEGKTVVTISKTINNKTVSDTVDVTVESPIFKIEIDQDWAFLNVGETYKPTVSHFPKDVPAPTYTWSVDPQYAGIVSVDADGTVHALAPGRAYVKVSAGKCSDGFMVVVSTASGDDPIIDTGKTPTAGNETNNTGNYDPSSDPGAGSPDGWYIGADSKAYWYEGGVRQGTFFDTKGVVGDGSIRGREIYDPISDGWYWLDSIYDGAKACNKEVWMPYIYQNEAKWDDAEITANAKASGLMADQVKSAIKNHEGKWVRYDANGKMYKGWYHVVGDQALIYDKQVGNWYYYDPKTGLMAKGWLKIDGKKYHFDESTGKCLNR